MTMRRVEIRDPALLLVMMDRYKRLIEGENLTNVQCAERFGVSPSTISKWRKDLGIVKS